MRNPFRFLLRPVVIRSHTHTHYPGFGQAGECQVDVEHVPVPLRFVWHHILPRAAGGKTAPGNLVALCDNCHYSVHMMLRTLKEQGTLPPDHSYNPDQVALAQQGYDEAVKLGTVDKLPDEGDAIT